MNLYVWKLGEIALARVCTKVYAKVKVVKNEDGLFHDVKVQGISANQDGSLKVTEILCYYVEVCRTGHRFWLPYTSLHLAERSRPFYGADKEPLPVKPSKLVASRKRKIMEDHIVPLEVKLPKTNSTPDLNTTFDIRHQPVKQGKYENAFSEFVRRGKEMLFDHFFSILERTNEQVDLLNYLKNIDASTEDKLEAVIKGLVTEKELDSYLHQCWRYNYLHKQSSMDSRDATDKSDNTIESPTKTPTVHTQWCLVCGECTGRLRDCPACPAAFHLACRKEWLVTIIHRKNPPEKPAKSATVIQKVLSSTRTVRTVYRDRDAVQLCPSCMWGPRVGYDDVVWHKLGSCSWWPARVLPPGAAPPRLLACAHTAHQWPLRYYGTLNHSWGEASRMCLFLPSHAAAVTADEARAQAVLDACDDYISVYLT